MTTVAGQVLEAWSGVLGSARVRELATDRVWELSDHNGVRYALKKVTIFGGTDPVRRLTDEARILGFLAQRGLPVATPVLTDSGSVYASDDAGSLYALTPMLPFDDSRTGLLDDVELYENVGSTVARMHVALAECPYGIDSWQVGPNAFVEAWQRLRDRLPATSFEPLAERVEPWRGAILHALADPHKQRVHGDVHGANVLTDRRTVTGIIDFDHLPLAPRTFDLGYYLGFWGHWALEQEQSIEPATALVTRHLLTGYHAVTTLTPSEVDGIPAMSLAVTLLMADFFLKEHDVVEDSWIRAAHWITEHPDPLRFGQP